MMRGSPGGGDAAEGAGSGGGSWRVGHALKIGGEDVEKFATELEAHALIHLEVLEGRHIPALEAGLIRAWPGVVGTEHAEAGRVGAESAVGDSYRESAIEVS